MYSTQVHNLFLVHNSAVQSDDLQLSVYASVSQQDGYVCDPGRGVGGPGFTTG